MKKLGAVLLTIPVVIVACVAQNAGAAPLPPVIGPTSTAGYPKVRPESTYGVGKPANASYVVSFDDEATNITRTTINIYVPKASGSVDLTVHNFDMCTHATDSGPNRRQLGETNSFDQSLTDTGHLNGSPRTVSTFTVSGTTSAVKSGTGRWNDDCASDARNQTIRLQGGSLDAQLGYRKYTLVAVANTALDSPHMPNAGSWFVNLFWLSAPSGVVFSQASTGNTSSDAKSFGYQLSSPIPLRGNDPPDGNLPANRGWGTYFDTSLPFGTSCDITTETTRSISFYDLDSGFGAIQPASKQIFMRLVDESATPGPQGVELTHSDQGSVVGGTPLNGYVYRVSGGNTQTVTANFTAKPGHHYVLYLSNIFYNNTLQFGLPFDSIYYYTTCANLDGSSGVAPTKMAPGGTATWTHSISNSGPSNVTNVKAEVYQSIVDKNNNPVGGVVSKGTIYNGTLNSGQTRTDTSKTYLSSGTDIGYKICQWLVWTSDQSGDDGNGTNKGRPSPEQCVTITKQPKVQIHGGNLRVNGEVKTSYSAPYGSWAEYSALINGNNVEGKFGTGASLRSGGSVGKQLTFANTSANGGNFGDSGINTPVTLSIPSLTTNCGAATSLSQSCSTTGNTLSIDANTDVTGTIYINAPQADVTITGDIKYANRPFGQLPQVIIKAKSVKINANVRQVDAWILTPFDNGSIKTCQSTDPLDCTERLDVNGPVATHNLSLPRSAGSDSVATQGDPAEVFNLRADSYLWAYSEARSGYVPQTAQVTSLPPRY